MKIGMRSLHTSPERSPNTKPKEIPWFPSVPRKRN